MNNQPFVIERTFDAPVARVWQAITDRDQMKQWYFDIPDFKAEVGTKFTFIGCDPDCAEWVHRCEVREVIPMRRLTYSWRYEGLEGDSLVTWELFEEGNMTRLKLTHTGLETFPPIKQLGRDNFAAGWNQLIRTSLLHYLTGIDAAISHPQPVDHED